MTVTACIVQARLGSTRLAGKILKDLPTGRLVIEEVLYRAHRVPGVDVVVCAIPDAETIPAEVSEEQRLRLVNVFRRRQDLLNAISRAEAVLVLGPEHDVLARYAKAAEAVKADVIMRITADCPLIDPRVCGKVLQEFRNIEAANGDRLPCSNALHGERTWPQGLDCEVFPIELLRAANEQATEPSDREHVFPYMTRLRVPIEVAQEGLRNDSHLRWTLDTLADYVEIWRVMEEQMREAPQIVSQGEMLTRYAQKMWPPKP